MSLKNIFYTSVNYVFFTAVFLGYRFAQVRLSRTYRLGELQDKVIRKVITVSTIAIRFTETYPNLAWIFSLILTEPIFSLFGYGMKENKVTISLMNIAWLSILEEAIRRWWLFPGYNGNPSTNIILLSSHAIGALYYTVTKAPMAYRYFGLLGLTYGFASRKYSSVGLLLHRAGLYAVLMMVV